MENQIMIYQVIFFLFLDINFESTVCGTNIKKFSIVYDPSDVYRVRTKNEGSLLTKCNRCLIF
jgi:hypothetical protein